MSRKMLIAMPLIALLCGCPGVYKNPVMSGIQSAREASQHARQKCANDPEAMRAAEEADKAADAATEAHAASRDADVAAVRANEDVRFQEQYLSKLMPNQKSTEAEADLARRKTVAEAKNAEAKASLAEAKRLGQIASRAATHVYVICSSEKGHGGVNPKQPAMPPGTTPTGQDFNGVQQQNQESSPH